MKAKVSLSLCICPPLRKLHERVQRFSPCLPSRQRSLRSSSRPCPPRTRKSARGSRCRSPPAPKQNTHTRPQSETGVSAPHPPKQNKKAGKKSKTTIYEQRAPSHQAKQGQTKPNTREEDTSNALRNRPPPNALNFFLAVTPRSARDFLPRSSVRPSPASRKEHRGVGDCCRCSCCCYRVSGTLRCLATDPAPKPLATETTV